MHSIEQQQRELHIHGEQETVTASAHAGESSPYRHDDWFGALEADSQLTTEQVEKRGTSKALWIAKTVLRREATVLCPHCLEQHDRAIPLSEPDEYVPREVVIPRKGGKDIIVELAVLPKAHRYCEDCGSVSFGGPLADRGFEEFRAVLEELCESAKFVDFPESRLQKELSDSLAKKGREEGPHDVTIVRSFVENLLNA